MILSTKSMLQQYQKTIGQFGQGPDVLNFDRYIMIGIVGFSLFISGIGLLGLSKFLLSQNFGMTALSMMLAVAGIYSALGVHREFVCMKLVAESLPNLEDDETKTEMLKVLINQNQNGVLIDRLLSAVEKIFSKSSSSEGEQP